MSDPCGSEGSDIPQKLGAQLALEDLSGGIAEEWLGPEPEPGRHIEGCQPLADEAGQLVGADIGAGSEDDDGSNLLAEDGMGTPMTAQSATAGCSKRAASTSTQ